MLPIPRAANLIDLEKEMPFNLGAMLRQQAVRVAQDPTKNKREILLGKLLSEDAQAYLESLGYTCFGEREGMYIRWGEQTKSGPQ